MDHSTEGLIDDRHSCEGSEEWDDVALRAKWRAQKSRGKHGSNASFLSFYEAALEAENGHQAPSPAKEETRREIAILRLLMFFMGASAFPITETLLLQTSMFVQCFQYGHSFYGASVLALFLPGLIMQLIQNRKDYEYDIHFLVQRNFGTFKINLFRLALAHALQILALMVFLLVLSYVECDDMLIKYVVMVSCFVCVGMGAAVSYGTTTQIVSLCQAQHHPFFFVGTFAVSVLMAPVNALLGDLCDFDLFLHLEDPKWPRIMTFYAVAVLFALLGLAAYIVLGNTITGKKMFAAKDEALRESVTSVAGGVHSQDDMKSEAGGSSPVGEEHTPSRPLGFSELEGYVGQPSEGEAPPPCEREVHWTVLWRQCLGPGLAVLLTLVVNMITVAQYTALPIKGQIHSLHTIMYYSYFAAQCLGTISVLHPAVRRCLTVHAMLFVAALRFGGVVLIFEYNSGNPIFDEVTDFEVLAFFTVFMWIGGALFSCVFSVATAMFSSPQEKAESATVMNVFYYVGICVASSLSIFLKS